MFDARTVTALISNTSQDECREIGNLFLSFADTPRDASWHANFRRQLASFPVDPPDSLEVVIETARKRVIAESDRLWALGWHPDQMRKKLKELGYRDGDLASGTGGEAAETS